jgi:hypothetical protein
VDKSSHKIWATPVIFKENSRPIGENSPNLVTLQLSTRTARKRNEGKNEKDE